MYNLIFKPNFTCQLATLIPSTVNVLPCISYLKNIYFMFQFSINRSILYSLLYEILVNKIMLEQLVIYSYNSFFCQGYCGWMSNELRTIILQDINASSQTRFIIILHTKCEYVCLFFFKIPRTAKLTSFINASYQHNKFYFRLFSQFHFLNPKRFPQIASGPQTNFVNIFFQNITSCKAHRQWYSKDYDYFIKK